MERFRGMVHQIRPSPVFSPMPPRQSPALRLLGEAAQAIATFGEGFYYSSRNISLPEYLLLSISAFLEFMPIIVIFLWPLVKGAS